jgi:DtxR family Mn-dependent transcriptional regulator
MGPVAKNDGISASMEDYVEAIFLIVGEKKAVRAKDIADRLGVKRPSVTNALQALAREGLVIHSPYDVIALTDHGEEVAREVVRRHSALREFLVGVLGVVASEADRMACGIEHAVSRGVASRIAQLTGFMMASPDLMRRWQAERTV